MCEKERKIKRERERERERARVRAYVSHNVKKHVNCKVQQIPKANARCYQQKSPELIYRSSAPAPA
jgi:hypothetical protein